MILQLLGALSPLTFFIGLLVGGLLMHFADKPFLDFFRGYYADNHGVTQEDIQEAVDRVLGEMEVKLF